MCVCVCKREYLLELAHREGKQVDKLLLVLVDAHAGNLRQTFERNVAKHRHVQELKHKDQSHKADEEQQLSHHFPSDCPLLRRGNRTLS